MMDPSLSLRMESTLFRCHPESEAGLSRPGHLPICQSTWDPSEDSMAQRLVPMAGWATIRVALNEMSVRRSICAMRTTAQCSVSLLDRTLHTCNALNGSVLTTSFSRSPVNPEHLRVPSGLRRRSLYDRNWPSRRRSLCHQVMQPYHYLKCPSESQDI